MDVRECQQVLKDAELLGLVPPESRADMVVERARTWSYVIGDITQDDAMAALRKLARQDFRGYIHPVELVKTASALKWKSLDRARRVKEYVLAEEEALKLRSDPEYRAKREREIQKTRDAAFEAINSFKNSRKNGHE